MLVTKHMDLFFPGQKTNHLEILIIPYFFAILINYPDWKEKHTQLQLIFVWYAEFQKLYMISWNVEYNANCSYKLPHFQKKNGEYLN